MSLRRVTALAIVLLSLGLLLPVSHLHAAPLPPPSAREVQIGKQNAAELESRYKVVADAAINERVQRIAQTIIPFTDRSGVTYVVKVLDLDVVNAVSLPGGWIYLTRGMLGFVRSDHELAAVLAHEMVHVAHAHGMEMIRREARANLLTILVAALTGNGSIAQGLELASIGILASFSRDMERDADLTGIAYLQKTPYSPVGMLTLLERMVQAERYRATIDLGTWADHPESPERVAYVEADLKRRGIPLVRRVTANYLRLAVREANDGDRSGAELLIDDKVIVRLADVDRVREMADRLDRLFNADLQSYEIGVRAQGSAWVIQARGVTILTVTAQDGAAAGVSARDLAVTIHARLRATIEEDIRQRKLFSG